MDSMASGESGELTMGVAASEAVSSAEGVGTDTSSVGKSETGVGEMMSGEPSGLLSGEIAAGREETVEGTLAAAGLLKPKLWPTIPKTSARLRHCVRDSIIVPPERFDVLRMTLILLTRAFSAI